jgi:hypothetical protein
VFLLVSELEAFDAWSWVRSEAIDDKQSSITGQYNHMSDSHAGVIPFDVALLSRVESSNELRTSRKRDVIGDVLGRAAV